MAWRHYDKSGLDALQHFEEYKHRKTVNLPIAERNGWTLKRYAVLAENRLLDAEVCNAALEATLIRLPEARNLENASGNHGVGFQIIHFAETAIVVPTFYWMWGSVLAKTKQIRAPITN